MKLSNQLFRNYSELADIILHCYKDLVILDFYRTLQIGDKEKYCKSININNHLWFYYKKIWRYHYGKFVLIMIPRQIRYLNFEII